jgi:hypothetical protein
MKTPKSENSLSKNVYVDAQSLCTQVEQALNKTSITRHLKARTT